MADGKNKKNILYWLKKGLCNLLLTRDVLAKDKMLNNKGIYQRYEIEWIGREGLAPETHDAYLKEFINHFYKNTLKLIDRAMRKEDNSPQVNTELSLVNTLNTVFSLGRARLSQSCYNIFTPVKTTVMCSMDAKKS